MNKRRRWKAKARRAAMNANCAVCSLPTHGNGNVIADGRTVCDLCHAEVIRCNY